MTSRSAGPLGHDVRAYEERDPGLSDTPLRDALWALVERDLAGAVLDLGSGGGGWLQRVVAKRDRLSRVASVDIVDSGASKLPGVEFHLADLSNGRLPFDDAAFDWIFCVEVIEHVANPRHLVAEAARCLKRGGTFVLTTPSNDSIRARFSLLARGYYPAFCDRDYRVQGHITPILEIDLKRMAAEAAFAATEFLYPFEGRLPMLAVTWQQLLGGVRGKLWSDTLMCRMTR